MLVISLPGILTQKASWNGIAQEREPRTTLERKERQEREDIADAAEICYTEPKIFKGSNLRRNHPGTPT